MRMARPPLMMVQLTFASAPSASKAFARKWRLSPRQSTTSVCSRPRYCFPNRARIACARHKNSSAGAVPGLGGGTQRCPCAWGEAGAGGLREIGGLDGRGTLGLLRHDEVHLDPRERETSRVRRRRRVQRHAHRLAIGDLEEAALDRVEGGAAGLDGVGCARREDVLAKLRG